KATGIGLTGFTPTGTVAFRFYGSNTVNNTNVGDCTDSGIALGSVALDSSGVADPTAATDPLHGGKYGFRAYYQGSADYNAKTAGCEKLTINKANLTSLTTALHLGSDHTTDYQNTSTLPAFTVLHDSATATGNGVAGFTPTGTVTFTMYGANVTGAN